MINLLTRVLPTIPRRKFGQVWTARDSIRAWKKVAISGDGKKQIGIVTNGQIYVSIDSGNSWAPKYLNKTWADVAISYNGEIQVAVEDNATFGQIYVSYNFGETWDLKGPTIQQNFTYNFKFVSISLNGQFMTALTNGEMYRSSDFGNTWVYHLYNGNGQFAPWIFGGSGAFKSAIMSSTGQIQTVTASQDVFVSVDFGNNWTKTSPLIFYDGKVAMSADGVRQILIGTKQYNAPNQRSIFTSANSGSTWTERDALRYWESIAMSENGQIAIATTQNGGPVYVSNNYGFNWTAKPASGTGAGMSLTGEKQVAGNWLSLDFGSTWVQNPLVPSLLNPKISSDGTTGVALVSTQSQFQIYTSKRTRI